MSESMFSGGQVPPKGRRGAGLYVLAGYLVVAVAGLIALRATISELDFLGVGWMLALVLLPTLPWLLPSLGHFLKAVSPYVQAFKVGAIQVDLRALQALPIRLDGFGGPPGLTDEPQRVLEHGHSFPGHCPPRPAPTGW